jgi:DNA-3-methyladenine glycosylase II
MSEHREIAITGRFSLRAAAEFGFGPNEGGPPPYEGTMRMAFAVDGGLGYAGAVLRQPEPDGPVQVELTLRDGPQLQPALTQVARVISLDHDGAAFARVGEADPVIGALQRAHPGQRPGSPPPVRCVQTPPERAIILARALRRRRSP